MQPCKSERADSTSIIWAGADRSKNDPTSLATGEGKAMWQAARDSLVRHCWERLLIPKRKSFGGSSPLSSSERCHIWIWDSVLQPFYSQSEGEDDDEDHGAEKQGEPGDLVVAFSHESISPEACPLSCRASLFEEYYYPHGLRRLGDKIIVTCSWRHSNGKARPLSIPNPFLQEFAV